MIAAPSGENMCAALQLTEHLLSDHMLGGGRAHLSKEVEASVRSTRQWLEDAPSEVNRPGERSGRVIGDCC